MLLKDEQGPIAQWVGPPLKKLGKRPALRWLLPAPAPLEVLRARKRAPCSRPPRWPHGALAHEVYALVRYQGLPLAEACRLALALGGDKLKGDKGFIAVDPAGHVALVCNHQPDAPRLPRGRGRALRAHAGRRTAARRIRITA